MTDKEIIEGNKLIAEFMGIKEVQSSYDSYGQLTPIWYTKNDVFKSNVYSVPNKSFAEFLKKAKYSSSWDWLMPVVEKINKDYVFDVSRNYVRIYDINDYNEQDDTIYVIYQFLCDDKKLIDLVWLGVVEFIKWYNKNK